LKSTGIKVSTIYPGATWSDSWKGVNLPMERLMQANDVAQVIISSLKMSPSAVMEEIILRPQLGDFIMKTLQNYPLRSCLLLRSGNVEKKFRVLSIHESKKKRCGIFPQNPFLNPSFKIYY
jgi:hypothetical protein